MPRAKSAQGDSEGLKPDVERDRAVAQGEAGTTMVMRARALSDAYEELREVTDPEGGPKEGMEEDQAKAQAKVYGLEAEIQAYQSRNTHDPRPEPEPLPAWVPDPATDQLYDARKQLERMVTWTVKKVLEEQAGMDPRAAGQMAWRITDGELEALLSPVLGYVKAHLAQQR